MGRVEGGEVGVLDRWWCGGLLLPPPGAAKRKHRQPYRMLFGQKASECQETLIDGAKATVANEIAVDAVDG